MDEYPCPVGAQGRRDTKKEPRPVWDARPGPCLPLRVRRIGWSDGESLSRRSLALRQRPLFATSADMATKSPGRGWRPGLECLRTNVGGCPDALILPKDG
jgi:hypothetical protein